MVYFNESQARTVWYRYRLQFAVNIYRTRSDCLFCCVADDYFGPNRSAFDILSMDEVGECAMIISEQGKELEMTNSSREDNLNELQENLDDMAEIQTQIREEATLVETDISQQIVELENQLTLSNPALQNFDVNEKKIAELLENCQGTEVYSRSYHTVCIHLLLGAVA